MDCACGFSCGTQAAFVRHLRRFTSSADHRRVEMTQHQESQLRTASEYYGRRGCSAATASIEAGLSVRGTSSSRVERAVTQCPAWRGGAAERDEREHTEHTSSGSAAAPTSHAGCVVIPSPLPFSFVQPSMATAASGDGTPFGGSSRHASDVRLLMVRHGRSENRGRGDVPALPDPGLTALGYDQAEAVADRLVEEIWGDHSVVLVSSPMKRCLLTIQPVLRRLRLKRGCCICHGGGYEFKGAGAEFGGTSSVEIAREFPEWEFVGFHSSGRWDYRGVSPKETDSEVRARAQRFVHWLRELVREDVWSKIPPGDSSSAPCTDERTSRPGQGTIVLVGHQSFGDLLCQLLVSGTDASWEYGMPTYRMKNAAITELVLPACGAARLGILLNDDHHLVSLRGIHTAR